MAPRITIAGSVLDDPAGLEATIAELRTAALQRQRQVFDLDGAFERRNSVETAAPYALGPLFSFAVDELIELIWSNSVDGRQAGRATWSPIDEAVQLGCTVCGDNELGDVHLPDGPAVWLDAGPIMAVAAVDGLPVIPRIALEHGSLRPFAASTGDAGQHTAAELAPDQRAAVTHPAGSARIIAPAGSGKTRVLTERARYLLRTWQLPAAAVSLVAFNKRARGEMSERTRDLPGLQVRTLNAIALAVINGVPPFGPQPRQYSTIDEPAVRKIIGDLVQFPRRRNTDPVAPWIEALSLCRLGLVAPHIVERRYDGDVDGFAAAFPRYRDVCAQRGVIDFDDQIYRAIEVLLGDPRARRAAQRASRLLLVDEFQDLTPAHVLLVRLLAGPQGSVFGVGDDDQTIYGYNGADPGWLIDFATVFPGAGDHPLEINYRCPGGIVSAADRLLRHNSRRVAKTIRSASSATDGWTAVVGDDTLTATADAVVGAVANGSAARDIAVLTRVNSLLAPVQVALAVRGILTVGGVGREFLNRTSVSSALSWLRIAVSRGSMQHDDVAEALRRPSRPLNPRVAEWVADQGSTAELLRLADRLKTERDAARVREFVADIEQLRALAGRRVTTSELLIAIRDEIGLGGAVATLDTHRHGMNRAAQNDDLTALLQLASLQPDAAAFPAWLGEQLGRTDVGAVGGNGVTLATVHRVKGQEWPHVVVHHAADDQFPHRLAEDHEEERRLFHVALTRASRHATLVAPRRATPFLAELTTEPLPIDRTVSATAAASRRPAATAGTDPKTRLTMGASSVADRPGKGLVWAAVGLVLVDQGHDWLVTAVTPDEAVTTHGDAIRSFAFGATVTTRGARKGKLTAPLGSSPATIRADDLLRITRRTLAAGRPAYVVFDDATIDRIASAMPRNLEELAAVQGIGPAKLDAYGAAILAAVEDALVEP